MNIKSFFIVLLMLSLMTFMGVALTHAATFDVDMGTMAPPCGGSAPFKIFSPADIGFVDCASNTGGIDALAMTTIAVGDIVRWTMRSIPHTVTGGSPLTGAPPGVCATGDNFDSGIANADTPGFVFTHTFSTPGTCAYFCIFHAFEMQGQVNIAAASTTTTTTTTSTTTTTTCNDQNKGQGKDKGKGHDKGRCKGHSKDK